MTHKLDSLRTKLLGLVGAGFESLSTNDLWLVYMRSLGYPTVLEGMAREAASKGVSLDAYQNGDFSVGLGTELAVLSYSQYAFSGTGAPTGDVNGIHWNGSNSLATAVHTCVTEDNKQYEITYEVFNYTAGGVRAVIGGETTAHGFTGLTRTANGVYTERGFTNNAGSTIQDQFRFQSTVTTTTLSVRNISVRRVL